MSSHVRPTSDAGSTSYTSDSNTGVHVARPGETARQVSRDHRVDPHALQAANPQIQNLDLPLADGEELVIPQDPESRLDTYTVGPGEAVQDIARDHGVSTASLLEFNGIANADAVYPGAVLVIPPADANADAGIGGDARAQALQAAGTARDEALAAVGVPVEQWTSKEAAQYTAYLAQVVAEHPGDIALADALIVVSEQELQRGAELLGNATENKDDEKADVKALTENVSILGNAASEDIAAALAIVVAEQIPNDSEQNWVDDGFGEFVDRSGDERFLEMLGAALHSQGKGDASDEMLHTSAGGVFGEGGLFDDVFTAIREFPGNVWEFAYDRVLNPAGDWLRDRITGALAIEQRIAALNEPGDSIFVGADVAGNVLGMDLDFAGGVKISITDQGRYRVELFGEGALGVAQELSLPGVNLAEGELSADISLGMSLSFEFDSAAEATAAAESITGMAAGVALLGTPAAPLGGVLIAATADELDWVGSAYTGASIELTGTLQAGGKLPDVAESLGIPEAQVKGLAAAGVRLEILPNGTQNLVYSTAFALEGQLDLDAPVDLPGGMQLGRHMGGSVSLQVETSVPLDMDMDDLLADPVGTVVEAVANPAGASTTTVNGVVNLQEGGSGGVSTASAGIQLQFKAAVDQPGDMYSAISQAVGGDLLGALTTLGDGNTEFTLRRYAETTIGIGDPGEFVDGNADNEAEGESVSVPGVISAEITVGYAQRVSDIVWSGQADAIPEVFGEALDGVLFQTA